MIETSDVGRTVLCDFCNEDYTDSPAQGGIAFNSYAVCPECNKKPMSPKLIKARCPDGMSFANWVRDVLRKGKPGQITIITGPDAVEALASNTKHPMSETKKRIVNARGDIMPTAVNPMLLKKETPPKVQITKDSAVAPVVYEYNASDELPPFERFDRLAHFLGSNTHCYTPGVLNEIKVMVKQYERIVDGSKAFSLRIQSEPTSATVNVSEAHARKILADAETAFIKTIAAYEVAAQLMMGVDFNRGLTVATWAKSLRVKLTEMKLEGA